MSGSGKLSALKVFEDLGFYCVDNLPVDLIPQFTELARQSEEIERCAVVADVREGSGLRRLPDIVRYLKRRMPTSVIFLEADDDALIHRFSETRLPHPLGTCDPVTESHQLRALASAEHSLDRRLVIDTSKFNVHELRAHLMDRLLISPVTKADSGLLRQFRLPAWRAGGSRPAVRCPLPAQSAFCPGVSALTGKRSEMAKYIRSFPQTQEFISRISDLLVYLLPHYVEEGKSYLTIGFGCTGGQHRSVLIAEEVVKRLQKAGYRVKVTHRDCPRENPLVSG